MLDSSNSISFLPSHMPASEHTIQSHTLAKWLYMVDLSRCLWLTEPMIITLVRLGHAMLQSKKAACFWFNTTQMCVSFTSQQEVVLAALPDFSPWTVTQGSGMLQSCNSTTWKFFTSSNLDERGVWQIQTITRKSSHYHLHFSDKETCLLPKVFPG